MTSLHRLALAPAAVLLLAPSALLHAPAAQSAAPTLTMGSAAPSAARFGQLPIVFERNQGQTDASVHFFSRDPGYSLFLTPTEAVFNLRPAHGRSTDKPTSAAVIRMALTGANPDAQVEGLEPQASRSHYLHGSDPAQWRRDVAQYGKVRYRAAYDGIDVVYYGSQQQLEYDFVLAPHADPAQIGLRFDGADGMRLDETGNLVLATDQGDLLQHRPVAYQDIGGQRRPVAASYRLLANQRVAFVLGDYDRTQPLVIDPVLSYSLYLGGSGAESAEDIAIDASGNVYVTGSTNSIDFPLATRPANVGKWDVYVSKLNANGTLVYSAYFGGSEDELVSDLAVDGLGNVYVTGETRSSNFPVVGAFQAALSTGSDSVVRPDAFVAKLNPAGNALVYSTYLGGPANDAGWGIAADANGNAYVTGYTQSAAFPVKNALRPSLKGSQDAFVTKFNATGSALVYSTYLGGSSSTLLGGGWDDGGAIAVDTAGNAYVAGFTRSADFPTTAGALKTSGDGDDAFVAKLNASGSALLYSTYLGGSGIEHARAIVVDGGGNAYVVGQTYSDTGTNDFPTAAPLQGAFAGGYSDAFISKINAAGSALLYSTYLGGSGYDYAEDIAVDSAGNAYVTGATASENFPIAAAWQRGYGGSAREDAFVSKLSAAGSALVYSSYLGGTNDDGGHGIALNAAGNAYVAGGTGSFDMRNRPWQSIRNGSDAFVVKIDATGSPPSRTRNDFNDDGKADIVWWNPSTGFSTKWLSASSSMALAQPWLEINWKAVGLGDFNGDNKTDILWRDAPSGINKIWLSGAWEQGVGNLPSPWFVAGVGDFNGNGWADILWRNSSTGANVIWRSAKSALVTNPGAAGTAWTVAGVGDFDGDGKSDILWRHSTTGENVLWKAGSSTTSVALARVSNLAWKVAGVGDFDGDGKDDILWRNGASGGNALWKSANVATQVTLTGVTNPAWKIASVADYDGDRRSDILWRNTSTGTNVIWKSANYATQQNLTGLADQNWIVVP